MLENKTDMSSRLKVLTDLSGRDGGRVREGRKDEGGVEGDGEGKRGRPRREGWRGRKGEREEA